MSSFTENLYLKRAIRQLQEENLKLRKLIYEGSFDDLHPMNPLMVDDADDGPTTHPGQKGPFDPFGPGPSHFGKPKNKQRGPMNRMPLGPMNQMPLHPEPKPHVPSYPEPPSGYGKKRKGPDDDSTDPPEGSYPKKPMPRPTRPGPIASGPYPLPRPGEKPKPQPPMRPYPLPRPGEKPISGSYTEYYA